MSWATDLILAQDGDVIIIPLALVRAIGLNAAVFLRQAAYLSAVVKNQDGWFFLEQEGSGNPAGKTIFERLGSWQAAIGLGPDAQASVRRYLKSLELLEENRKMVHGKLQYRVDSEKYLNFLSSCNILPLSICNIRQTGNPDCTNQISGLSKPGKPDCTIGETGDDIYKEDIPRIKNTTTTLKVNGSSEIFNNLSIEPVISQYLPQLLDVLQQAKIEDIALAQDLLDELAGTIEAGNRGDRKKVGNPISWLKTLAAGEFNRVRCFETQARRRHASILKKEMEGRNAFTPTSDPAAMTEGEKLFASIRQRRESKSKLNPDA